MKVIEVIYNWPAEVFIQRHSNAVSSKGIIPVMVARHSNPSMGRYSSIQGSETNALIMPNFDHMNRWKKVASIRYLVNFRKKPNYQAKVNSLNIRNRVLLSYFESLKPDLIHFHFASLAVSMAWIPQTLGIPYTLSLRGSDIQVDPLISKGYQDQLREVILLSSGIHSVCDNLWELAVQRLDLQSNELSHKTIYTTVSTSYGEPPSKDVYEHGLFRFITTGRIHWRKSYVNLLIALRRYIDNGDNATLTIIGDGNGKEELLYWVHVLKMSQSVNLIGKMTYAEFAPLLLNSDAYIQSSIAEGFSNATAEAMAMGLPVFATDVGGTSEIIQDGINGFLLDPIHPQDWYKKMCLVKDTDLMQKVGRNAFETAGKVFSPEKHAKEFIEFYTTVLNAQ